VTYFQPITSQFRVQAGVHYYTIHYSLTCYAQKITFLCTYIDFYLDSLGEDKKTSEMWRLPNLSFYYKGPVHTVHQRIVDPRLNLRLSCDWLKPGHVV